MSVLHRVAADACVPGDTPVVAIDLDVEGLRRRIWLKLESHNPNGSLKDRTAQTLWESVQDRVHPAEGIIESTSGNLGIALAARCARHSIPFTAVVEPRTSAASIDMMQGYGARVVMVDRPDSWGGYLLNRLTYVREQMQQRPRLVWTNQYENDANPRAHRQGTAPELWKQIQCPATVMVAVSTGGTLAGFRQFAAQQRICWTVVGVDVEGSIALVGESPGKRVLSGIGSSQPSAFVRSNTAPQMIMSPGEAVAACLWIRDVAGIELGGSSGALIAAALRWFQIHRHDDTDIVVICPDGGDRYLSTVYSVGWRRENISLSDPPAPRAVVQQVHRGPWETAGSR